VTTMKILETRVEDVLVLRPEGRLDGVTCGDVDARFATIAGEIDGPVVVDCGGLEFVSSAGLRSILVLGKRQRAAGRGFTLASPAPAVREIFDLSGFATLFKMHPDCDTAVASVRG
jgi:anti-sigma B factor antagonist